MPKRTISLCLRPIIFAFVTIVAGCQGYSYSLNEQPVYSTPALYNPEGLTDTRLLQCVKQTIEDKKIVRAEQLVLLACRNAGIRSVAGIQQFSELTQLDLRGSAVEDLSPLTHIQTLETLYLDQEYAADCTNVRGLRDNEVRVIGGVNCSKR